MNCEAALISRTATTRDDGKVVIEELWDTTHPASPWVVLDPPPHGRVYRWLIMSKREYDERLPPLKMNSSAPRM